MEHVGWLWMYLLCLFISLSMMIGGNDDDDDDCGEDILEVRNYFSTQCLVISLLIYRELIGS